MSEITAVQNQSGNKACIFSSDRDMPFSYSVLWEVAGSLCLRVKFKWASLKKNVLYLGLDLQTPHYSGGTRTFPWVRTFSLGCSQHKTSVHAFLVGATLLVPPQL